VVAPLAFKLTVAVGQIPPLALAVFTIVKVGRLVSTVTVITAEVVQLDGLVAVREYKVVELGETIMEEVVAPVLHE